MCGQGGGPVSLGDGEAARFSAVGWPGSPGSASLAGIAARVSC